MILNTSTSSANIAGSLKIEDIEAAMSKILGLPPTNWMLIAPDGRLWKGTEPLKLAAQALYEERNRITLNDI